MEGVTNVDPNLINDCAREARSLLAVLEPSHVPNLDELSKSFGTAAEWLLCDLFRVHPAASRYWVDGVVVDVAAILRRRQVLLKGRAWCADHRTQWQVPTEIVCAFKEAEPVELLSVKIRVGIAAFRTLADHVGRNITRREPKAGLLQFDVADIT